MQDSIKITRNQLRVIIGSDNDAIRQFEKLFAFAEETIQSGIADSTIIAESKANYLISEIHELKKLLVSLDARITALEP